jgi:hypothetical protein
VHISEGIPNVYLGEETGEAMLGWLTETSEGDVIEEVTPQIIEMLKEEQEYVGVLFTGPCLDGQCHEALEALTRANEDLAKVGIKVVKTRDEAYPAKEHQIEAFPAVGLYRNGQFLRYGGSLENGVVEKWFLDLDNLKIPGAIEEVNSKMMSYLYENDDDLLVLFYETSDRDADELLEGLETVDERFDKLNVSMVKISDEGAGEQFGITELPALVYIQSGIPNAFAGDPFKPRDVLNWVKHEANTTRIHEVSDIVLSKLVDKFAHLAAIFYTRDDDKAVKGLQGIAAAGLEAGVAIVKLHDEEEARSLGIGREHEEDDGVGDESGDDDYVQIVYFQHKVPSLVRADPRRPSAVLEWLVSRKRYPTIEEVTDRMLEGVVASHEFVAVFFQGDECEEKEEEVGEQAEGEAKAANEEAEEEKADKVLEEFEVVVDCDQVLAELEEMDDELDEIGILIVTTKDTRNAAENGELS